MATQLTTAQLATLLTEINTDPNGYGYAADVASGYDGGIRDKLNLVRTGSNGGPAITVKQPQISTFALLEAIDTRDFDTGTVNVQSHLTNAWFESITQSTEISLQNADGTANRVLGNLRRILQNPGTQGSRARVDALASRLGSRAEQLFYAGIVITADDVAAAFGRF